MMKGALISSRVLLCFLAPFLFMTGAIETDQNEVTCPEYNVHRNLVPTETLTLRLFPVGGAVYVDRKFIQNVSNDGVAILQLVPGVHELVVSRSGYHDHVSKIVATSGAQRAAVLSLSPLKTRLPKEPHHRVLRPGMTARGQLTLRAPKASDLFARRASDHKVELPAARGISIDLEGLSKDKVAIELVSYGAKINLHVVDDNGKVVMQRVGKEYRSRISFVPDESRSYQMILSHSVENKSFVYDMVRYAIAVIPNPKSTAKTK